jgi:hypothetical protein
LDFEDELEVNIAILSLNGFVTLYFLWFTTYPFVGDLQYVVVKHSSWFVKQYGNLAVWSTQGMEKSHYQAKTAFHKHTQHSGTAKHHSAIVQTFEWWYRVVQHKQYKIEKDEVLSTADAAAQAVKDARRQSSLSSTAVVKHAAW